MGGLRFNSDRQQPIQQLRLISPNKKNNNRGSRRPTIFCILFQQNSIAVLFYAIVTFSILSLWVQYRDVGLNLAPKVEGSFYTIPKPTEKDRGKELRTLIEAPVEEEEDDDDDDDVEKVTRSSHDNNNIVGKEEEEEEDDDVDDDTNVDGREETESPSKKTQKRLQDKFNAAQYKIRHKDGDKDDDDDDSTASEEDDGDDGDGDGKILPYRPHRHRNHDRMPLHKENHKDWFDFNWESERNFNPDKYIGVNDFVMRNPIDTLDGKFNHSSLRSVNLTNELPYLGVLLDAGRHYFPVEWIKRMINVLSIMNYNLLQFRLTDDQTFNVKLTSQPLLAYPTTLNNNRKVYSPKELRDIVKYAKSKGIQVVPEINVPGHAASWGGIPELIVQCPQFICKKGYGVPLNISAPALRHTLKDVMEEIVDIFDKPPFLHLGGDEVHMAQDCFDEVGEKMFDYNGFEDMLRSILLEVGYNDSQVIRWEMTYPVSGLTRAGNITHFWESQIGDHKWRRQHAADFSDPVLLSAGLYFDTNVEDSAFEVYVKTKRLKHNNHPKSPNLGVIAGTFELSTQFWFDRNVIGKLLAVSMGVSNINTFDMLDFFSQYREICKSSGFDDTMCELYGAAPRRYSDFRNELKGWGKTVWAEWIKNACERLTYTEHGRGYQNIHQNNRKNSLYQTSEDSKGWFWQTYFKETEWKVIDTINLNITEKVNRVHKSFLGKRKPKYFGIIMDIAQYPVRSPYRLEEIVSRTMSRLGLNTVQLGLINDFGFAYHSLRHSKMFYQPHFTIPASNNIVYPSINDLIKFREVAAKFGVVLMPEVSISTNTGGLYKSFFNVECSNFLCEHGIYIPQNINDASYVPVAYSIVQELLKLSSSEYLHLGYDERAMNTPCFLEASMNKESPNFDLFESKLKKMLEFAGVTSDRVVRWENKEKIHYPGRFGEITQCGAGESCESIASSSDKDIKSLPWFATVDVRRGGVWQVYSMTYDLASRSPIGLMADVGGLMRDDFNANFLDYRLLAFSIGTLELPKMDRDSFEKAFVEICSALASGVGGEDLISSNPTKVCKFFANSNEDAPSLVEINEEQKLKNFTKAICKERTKEIAFFSMRNASNIPTIFSLQQDVGIEHGFKDISFIN